MNIRRDWNELTWFGKILYVIFFPLNFITSALADFVMWAIYK